MLKSRVLLIPACCFNTLCEIFCERHCGTTRPCIIKSRIGVCCVGLLGVVWCIVVGCRVLLPAPPPGPPGCCALFCFPGVCWLCCPTPPGWLWCPVLCVVVRGVLWCCGLWCVLWFAWCCVACLCWAGFLRPAVWRGVVLGLVVLFLFCSAVVCCCVLCCFFCCSLPFFGASGCLRRLKLQGQNVPKSACRRHLGKIVLLGARKQRETELSEKFITWTVLICL